MSSLSQFGAGIKKVQRYGFTMSQISTTATVTLSQAVNLDKTFLAFNGISVASNTNLTVDGSLVRLKLTNATTVTCTRAASGGPVNGEFEVIEFY